MTGSVVVVIPCLNEQDYIAGTLAHFMGEPADLVRKIVVADGGSTDATVKIVQSCAQRDPRIALLDNPRKIQSSGVNRAVEIYGDLADAFVRVDAHSGYPPGFCSKLVEAHHDTGADSVVVGMVADGATCFQRAAAVAQNSRLGNGGAAHRMAAQGAFVDHGHHALMTVAAFRAVGGYDENFSHNEDAELDVRLSAAGYRIYLCGAASIAYFPRKTPLSLLKQYLNFGRGRAMNMRKHHTTPRIRQLIPILVAPAVSLALLSPVTLLALVPAAAWAIPCLAYGIMLGYRDRSPCAALAGVAAMIMHFGFSLGFWKEIAYRFVQKVAAQPDRAELIAGSASLERSGDESGERHARS